jgi:hypothetical protein
MGVVLPFSWGTTGSSSLAGTLITTFFFVASRYSGSRVVFPLLVVIALTFSLCENFEIKVDN